MAKWRMISSVFILITAFVALKPPNIHGQEDFRITVDADMSQISSFAWAPDNQTFVFLNNALASQSFTLQAKLDIPAWQTFNVETQTLSPGQTDYPLQPELTPYEQALFSPQGFVMPAPNNRDLIAFSRHDEDGYYLTFANRLTGAFLVTPLRDDEADFFMDSGLVGYWSQSGNVFVFPQGSEFSPDVTYYYIRVNPDDLPSTVLYPSSFKLDDETYVTSNDLEDYLLALSPDGDRVLLIARKSSDDPLKPTFNQIPYLIVWNPENPTENRRITAFLSEDICGAAFAPVSNSIALFMNDGSLFLHDFVTKTTQRLSAPLANGCSFIPQFSNDGRWLAEVNQPKSSLEFVNIGTLIRQGGPTLQPPVANAGDDIILTDTDGDGFEEITLADQQSFDPDGQIVSYRWSLGVARSSEGAVQTRQIPVGTYTFNLTVTDNDGLSDIDEITVVLNPPPK